MNRMMTTREKVARALFDRQLAFEREHSQHVVHPAWEVAYRDYWGPLAESALGALSFDEGAVERVAREIHDSAQRYEDRTYPPFEQWAEDWKRQARIVLRAACTATEGADDA